MVLRPRLFTACTLLAIYVAGVSCSDAPSGPSPRAGLSLISGAGKSDTIETELEDPLVVELRDAQKNRMGGVTIEFNVQPEPEANHTHAGIRLSSSTDFLQSVTTITDEGGRARVFVRLGRIAGAAEIHVTVPSLSFATVAHYSVKPGVGVGAFGVHPQDSAVLAGSAILLHGYKLDRFGNRHLVAATFTRDSGPGSVSPQGVLSSNAIGRIGVTASYESSHASAYISAVPEETFAGFYQPSYAGGQGGIVTFRSDGAMMTPLTSEEFAYIGPTFGAWPNWSPVRDRIAYVTGNTLYSVSSSGTIATLITNVPGYLGVDSSYAPMYSSDGTHIFFTAIGSGGRRSVWRVNANGSSSVQISQVLAAGIEAMPSPQPDGDLVAYQTNVITNSPTSFHIRLISSTTGVISYLDVPGSSPRWSPTGEQIAYLDGQGRINTMKIDGTDNKLITSFAVQPAFTWSPDAKWFLVVTDTGLAIVNVASGRALPLKFRGPGNTLIIQPAWPPLIEDDNPWDY
jgi:hypothetical protein